MRPIIIFTILQVSYYILRCIFPDFFVGGNIAAKNEDSIYPQVAMGLTNLFAYYLIYLLRKGMKKNKDMMLFFFIILMYFVWDGFRSIAEGFQIPLLINLMKRTSPYVMFYVLYLAYLDNKKITIKCMLVIAVTMICHAAYLFYFQLEYEKSLGLDGIRDSNYGAMIASALAFPLLIRKNKYALFSWGLMMLLVFYSGQRSAILVGILSIPVAWSSYKNTLKRTEVVFLIIVASLFSVPYFKGAYDNLIERTEIETESGEFGSGRSKFYPVALKGYADGNFVQTVFGRPQTELMDLIKKRLGIRITSHNGFIDMLFCYGFIGFIVYLNVFVSLFVKSKSVRKYASRYYQVYLYMIFAWLVQNLVTHGLFSPAYGLVFGYILVKTKINERRTKEKACLSYIGTYKSKANK